MNDKKRKRLDLLLLLAVLLAVSAYYLLSAQGSPTVSFSAEERRVAFYGSEGTSAVFDLDALTQLALYDGGAPDYGTAVQGGETLLGGFHYGTWQSTDLGTYQAYITTRVKPYVILSDGEKTAIFNVNDADATRSFYQQLDAFCKGELAVQN